MLLSQQVSSLSFTSQAQSFCSHIQKITLENKKFFLYGQLFLEAVTGGSASWVKQEVYSNILESIFRLGTIAGTAAPEHT